MEIKINKEILEYTESIFFGLSLRQCFFSALACSIAVAIYFLTVDSLGVEVTSWLCMLGAAPFAALGFIRYQGMNTEQMIVVMVRSLLLSNRKLIHQPINLYYEIVKGIIEKNKKEVLEKDDQKLFKIKKTKQRAFQNS